MSKEKLLAKYEKEISEFQEWIETQPRLPKHIGKCRKIYTVFNYVLS